LTITLHPTHTFFELFCCIYMGCCWPMTTTTCNMLDCTPLLEVGKPNYSIEAFVLWPWLCDTILALHLPSSLWGGRYAILSPTLLPFESYVQGTSKTTPTYQWMELPHWDWFCCGWSPTESKLGSTLVWVSKIILTIVEVGILIKWLIKMDFYCLVFTVDPSSN
jgi:hypothetical protein